MVISHGSKDFIVHVDAVKELDVETRPLDVVGVTENSLYWKDIRRVLFSEAAFTVLARVGRDGTHNNWNPVKLSQIFKEVVPNIVDDISNVSLSALRAAHKKEEGAFQSEISLEVALTRYGADLIKQNDDEIDDLQPLIKETERRCEPYELTPETPELPLFRIVFVS